MGFGTGPVVNPVSGGLAGLVKTADLEWNNVACTALDLPDDPDFAMARADVMAQLMIGNSPVEMGISARGIAVPQSMDAPAVPGKSRVTQKDVFLITGGARGVTARCALDIARHFSPTIVLAGRSAPPTPEPAWLTPLSDEGAIKKALLTHQFIKERPTPTELEQAFRKVSANREMDKNIRLMEAAGARVHYAAVDIRDGKKVMHLVKEMEKTYGPITGIIHGAGVVEDRLIQDKTPEQFDRVFDTKVKGTVQPPVCMPTRAAQPFNPVLLCGGPGRQYRPGRLCHGQRGIK